MYMQAKFVSPFLHDKENEFSFSGIMCDKIPLNSRHRSVGMTKGRVKCTNLLQDPLSLNLELEFYKNGDLLVLSSLLFFAAGSFSKSAWCI